MPQMGPYRRPASGRLALHDARGSPAGHRERSPHGLRLRAHRRRAVPHLRPHGDRQLRPRRVPDAGDVLDLLGLGALAARSGGLAAADGGGIVPSGLRDLPRPDPLGAGRAHAGPDLRHLRAGHLPALGGAGDLGRGLPSREGSARAGTHIPRRPFHRAAAAGGQRGGAPGLRLPQLVHQPHRDRAGAAGDGPGPAGGLAHGHQHGVDVRPRLGHRRGLRGSGGGALDHLLLRLPRRGLELRAAGLRDGGSRRLRQCAGDLGGGRGGGADRGAGRAADRAGAQVRGGLRPLSAGRSLAAPGAVRALLMPRPFTFTAGLVALALLLAFPLVFTLPYPRDVMIRIFLYAMLATAWNVLAGYCGQISLGHAIFFGTGAYTSTVLVKTLGLTPWAGMLAGAALAVALSQVIGYPVFRLRGHYFAIATIAVGEIVQTLMINWDWVGGARGLFIPIYP